MEISLDYSFSYWICKPSLTRCKSFLGCDTGFGLTLAQKFHAMGMTVFAGCVLKDRGGEGAKTLEAIAEQHDQNIIKKQLEGKSVEDRENKLHVLQLDVTNEDDWQRALAFIK